MPRSAACSARSPTRRTSSWALRKSSRCVVAPQESLVQSSVGPHLFGCTQELIEAGARATDEDCWRAIERNQLDGLTLRALIESAKLDVNTARDERGRTPLLAALCVRESRALRTLVEMKADVHAVTSEPRVPPEPEEPLFDEKEGKEGKASESKGEKAETKKKQDKDKDKGKAKATQPTPGVVEIIHEFAAKAIDMASGAKTCVRFAAQVDVC